MNPLSANMKNENQISGKATITIRRANERGHANHGWLDSYHSFSFAAYQDPNHESFGALRVINEDRVKPGMGFGMHGHRDMEIVSYVLDGALEHKDNMGTGSIIRPGDVQRMSAGRGVLHSEFNPSKKEEVHFLQIWIIPNVDNIPPSYEQKYFSTEQKRGQLCLIGSNDGRDGSVTVKQDVSIYAGLFDGVEGAVYDIQSERHLYIHIASGSVTINDNQLEAGDAIMSLDSHQIAIKDGRNAEILMFDLA